VSEKNSKKYEIAKIHEYIDNIILPSERSTPSYTETDHKLLQKKLFDGPAPTTSPTLREGLKGNPPAGETSTSKPGITEAIDYGKNDAAGLPEFEPIPEDQVLDPQDDDWLSSYDLLEVEVTWETNQGRQARNQRVSEPVSFEEVPNLEPTPVLERLTETPLPEPGSQPRKNHRKEQKLLRRELQQKVKRERQAYLQQDKEERRRKRIEKRAHKTEAGPKTPKENQG